MLKPITHMHSSTNVKIKMEGRPPPDDDGSTSLPNLLQDFPSLNIGARKKENVNFSSEKGEVSLEDDRDFEDVNAFENWSSLDRIMIDGSESSEWGRSISSSMSWFDESEQEATLKVKDMMDNIENMLYGESHTPLPKVLVEECQQWKMRFPHLRVVGTRILKSPSQKPEEDSSSNDEDVKSRKNEKLDYTRKNIQEEIGDKEEIYASHGTLEAEPEFLPHEFINPPDSLKDSETEKLKDSLLNEMALHIWKEVVVPSFNSYIEKNIKPKEPGSWSSSEGKEEPLGAFAIKNRQNAQDEQVDVVPLQPYSDKPSTSCSMTEMPVTEVLYDPDDPFECYRRYSEQLTYCSSSKLSSMFAPSEMEKEIGQVITVEKGCEIPWKNPGKSRRKGICASITCNNELQEKELAKNSPHERRLQLFTERGSRTGIVEDLMPLEKLNSKVSSRKEVLPLPKESLTTNQTRHLTLPAIEQGTTSSNTEDSNFFYRRSSSALPKLTSKTFRPTLSSYQSRIDKNTATRKSSKYNEVDPLKSEEVVHGQSPVSYSSKTRHDTQRKRNKSVRPLNVNWDHS